MEEEDEDRLKTSRLTEGQKKRWRKKKRKQKMAQEEK